MDEIEPIHALFMPEIAYRQCRCGCTCGLDDDECECTLIDCDCPKKTITEMIEEISGINKDLMGRVKMDEIEEGERMKNKDDLGLMSDEDVQKFLNEGFKNLRKKNKKELRQEDERD